MLYMPKELKKLFARLKKAGWRIAPSKSGWKCMSPDGKRIVTVHSSASDHRAMLNLRSEFRKAGFVE